MRVFVMIKGLPGCGKSTVAEKMIADSSEPCVRVERDDIRVYLGYQLGKMNKESEAHVTRVQEEDLRLVMKEKRRNVISSDTNLNPKCEALYRALCAEYGYEFFIRDMTNVPIETCIAQDAKREGPKRVGETVIRRMAKKYGVGEYAERAIQFPVAVTDPIPVNYTKPATIIVDLDGTIARMGKRNPYDEANVYDDEVRWHVVDAVKALYLYYDEGCGDVYIHFLSGRTDACYDNTLLWIMEKAGFDSDVYRISLSMRKAGDQRRDAIVKNELFDAVIRGKFNVMGVFDDRDQVIRECWLPKGLTVFNVGDGSIF